MNDFAYSLAFWAKYAYVDSAILCAALRLGLFENLPVAGTGHIQLAELAERIQSSWRGTRVIVEPLVSSNVLEMDETGRLALRQPLAALLHSPNFVTQLHHAGQWWNPAEYLLTAVRTGTVIAYDGQKWDLLGHCQDLFLAESVTKRFSEEAAEQLFDRVARHFLRTQAIICTAELGLFERFYNGPATLSALSEASGAVVDGLRVLLDVLVQLGLLVVEGTTYRYHSTAQRILNRHSLASYGRQGMHLVSRYWQPLGQLDVAVKADQRMMDLHNTDLGRAYHLTLARYNTGVFPFYFQLARTLPAMLSQVRSLDHSTICDVGAGSGIWGIALARYSPTTQVTFLDEESVLAQTRRNIERLDLSDQAHFWAADLLTVEFGTETFDVIVLGQICSTQYPDDLPGLFERLSRALRPDGYLVVADLMLNERRDGPLDYLYFAVKGFISTPGNVMSIPEYINLLRDAGLTASRHYHLLGIEMILAGRDNVTLPEIFITN